MADAAAAAAAVVAAHDCGKSSAGDTIAPHNTKADDNNNRPDAHHRSAGGPDTANNNTTEGRMTMGVSESQLRTRCIVQQQAQQPDPTGTTAATALQTALALSHNHAAGQSVMHKSDSSSCYSAPGHINSDDDDDHYSSHSSSLESVGRQSPRRSRSRGRSETPSRRRRGIDSRLTCSTSCIDADANDELGSSTSASVDSFEIADLTLSTSQYLRDDDPIVPAIGKPLSSLKEGASDEDADAYSSAGSTLLHTDTDNTLSSRTSGIEKDKSSSCTPSGSFSLAPSLNSGSAPKRPIGQLDDATKKSIHEELNQLDTGLPQLDFDRLQQTLGDAARETEMRHRKLMSEEVRRRLAAGDEDDDVPQQQQQQSDSQPHPPAPTTRPLRSNLRQRMQKGMHMQVCYVNAVCDEDDGEASSDYDESEPEQTGSGGSTGGGCSGVPKSLSTPDYLAQPHTTKAPLNRSKTTVNRDNIKSASQLRREAAARTPVNSERLESEARVMLMKAKETARLQYEIDKQTAKPVKSPIEEIVGVTLSKKLSRSQLTRMGLTQLQIIVNDLHSKIELLNEQLVHLLMERDSLHMEQDSMLVDIEDMLQHQRHSEIVMPEFLVQAPVDKKSVNRLRIFKR